MFLKGLQQCGYFLPYQLPAFFHQSIKPTVDTNPRFAVSIDITDGNVEHPPRMGIVVNMIRLSQSVECDERDLPVINHPDAPRGITIALHGRKSQQLSQTRMVRHHGSHRFQVDDIDSLVESHPEPMEIVLSNTAA